MASRQLNFDLGGTLSIPHSLGLHAAIEHMSTAACTDSRGAVFTRSEVVVLLPAIGRLLDSWKSLNILGSPVEDFRESIRTVELPRSVLIAFSLFLQQVQSLQVVYR